MTTSVRRQVGVLGGMGPAATVDFYSKLVQETPAGRDQDHLKVVIWADPGVPDRTEHLIGTGEDPTPWLERGICALVEAGCDVLAVPCNTAHAYVPRLASDAAIELVSIVETTAAAIAAEGVVSVGLLATTGTLRSGLYADALQRLGIEAIEPDETQQDQIMAVVHALKGGCAGWAQAQLIAGISDDLAARGAERVIAGCTELVLALDAAATVVPMIDPARVLARRVVQLAGQPLTRSR